MLRGNSFRVKFDYIKMRTPVASDEQSYNRYAVTTTGAGSLWIENPRQLVCRVEVAGPHERGPATETEPTTLERSTQQSATSRGLLSIIVLDHLLPQ